MVTRESVVVENNERVSPFVPMSLRELIGVGLSGAVVGLVVSVLLHLFTNYIFGAALCRDQGAECGNAPFYSMVVASVVGALIGLAALARQRIYRPLMVVLAAAISLWGFHVLVAGVAWWLATLMIMAFFALGYMLFAWLARIRSFLFAGLATVIAVVIVRLIVS